MLQPQADDQRLIQPVQLPRETIFDHRYVSREAHFAGLGFRRPIHVFPIQHLCEGNKHCIKDVTRLHDSLSLLYGTSLWVRGIGPVEDIG